MDKTRSSYFEICAELIEQKFFFFFFNEVNRTTGFNGGNVVVEKKPQFQLFIVIQAQ